MADRLEVGMKLRAKYSDGELYPAEVLKISESKKRAKAPVQVHFVGYGAEDDAWLSLDDLKSKRLTAAAKAEPAPKAKAKAKAAPAPVKEVADFSALTKGQRVQAEADGSWYAAEVVAVRSGKNAAVKVNYCGYTSASDEWLKADRLRSKAITMVKVDPNAKSKVSKLDLTSATDKAGALEFLANNRRGSNGRRESKATEPFPLTPPNRRNSGLVFEDAFDKPPGPAVDIVPILTAVRKFANSDPKKAAVAEQGDKKETKKPGTAIVESSAQQESTTICYKELYKQVLGASKTIAGLLANRKEGTPKHVCFLVNPGVAYAVVELAVWAAGGACVPLSVHSPAPELEYYIQDSEASLVIACPSMAKKIRPVCQTLGRTFAMINHTPEAATVFSIDPEDGAAVSDKIDTTVKMQDNALILYTSGTTGKPKGVVHTFLSLSASYVSLSKAWKWSSKDYTLHVLPLHHIHGVQNILNTAMYNGAAVEFTHFDAGHCLKRLASGDITCFHAVPTVYVKFTQYLDKISHHEAQEIMKGMRNDNMRYMVSGSAALPVPTMQSWAEISGHVLLERYGMTEIGMGISNKIKGTRYPGCVGWPLPFVRVKADDDGAILIKGPTVFKEYYKKEEITKKEFTEDGWFRTGDNVAVGGTPEDMQKMLDEARAVVKATGKDGNSVPHKVPMELTNVHKILGRSSVDIIKSGGYKISALEIESVLLTHEKIKECAVIGLEDETWGEKVAAIVLPKDGESFTLGELRDWGKSKMATYKVPQALDIVTELPRNQMGKLEKKKLMDSYKGKQL